MNAKAYIKGVLDGDGYITQREPNPYIGLKVTSREFAQTFFDALKEVGLTPHFRERISNSTMDSYSWVNHFFIVEAVSNKRLIQELREFKLSDRDSGISYLIGFYHSEGYLYIQKRGRQEYWHWRVYNKDVDKLKTIQQILSNLNIKTKIRNYPNLGSLVPHVDLLGKDNILLLSELGVKKCKSGA